MTATYEYGGLKMTNIFSFSKSLKLTWKRKLQKENYLWKHFIDYYLKSDKFN